MSPSSSPSHHLQTQQHNLPTTRPVYASFPNGVPASSYAPFRRRSSLDFTWSAAFTSLAQSSDLESASTMPEYTYLPQTIMSERRRSELFFPPAPAPAPPVTGDPMLDAFPYLAIGNQANYDAGNSLSMMGMVPEYFIAQQYQQHDSSIMHSHNNNSGNLALPRQCAAAAVAATSSPVSSASTTSVSPLDIPPLPLEVTTTAAAVHSSPLGPKWANFTMAQAYPTSSTNSQLSKPAKNASLFLEPDYPPEPQSAPPHILRGDCPIIDMNMQEIAHSQSYSALTSHNSPLGGEVVADPLSRSRLPHKASFRISQADSTDDASRESSTRQYESEETASPLTSQSSNSMSDGEDDDDDYDDNEDEYKTPGRSQSCTMPRRRSARQFVGPDMRHSLPAVTYHHGRFVDPGELHDFLPSLTLPSVPDIHWTAEQYSDGEGVDDDDSQEADEDDDESMEDKMARSKKGVYRCNHCPEKFNTMEQF
ncbi:hypothetical protein V1509DRAFT_559781 [Lipomyces kononenkoae]